MGGNADTELKKSSYAVQYSNAIRNTAYAKTSSLADFRAVCRKAR